MFVLIYVDDILITGDDYLGINNLKEVLEQTFKMKDLGLAMYFIRLEISRH